MICRALTSSRLPFACLGSPAILGSLVAFDRRGGSEDPRLCVPAFGQACPFNEDSAARKEKASILGST